MISTTEFFIFGNAFTCAVLAYAVLKSPDRRVRWARNFTYVMASASFLCGGAGWLLSRPWAVEALGRGTLVAIAVGVGAGALWLLRTRLRPRGFQATSRRYAQYKRVQS